MNGAGPKYLYKMLTRSSALAMSFVFYGMPALADYFSAPPDTLSELSNMPAVGINSTDFKSQLPLSTDGEYVEYPNAIDLAWKNNELQNEFPQRESGIPKRDMLANYRAALEVYRAGMLEQFNRDIYSICQRLKDYEHYVYALSRDKLIGPRRLKYEERRIKVERQRCSVESASSSDYFDLYYRYLALYKAEVDAVKSEMSACESSISCRSGE